MRTLLAVLALAGCSSSSGTSEPADSAPHDAGGDSAPECVPRTLQLERLEGHFRAHLCSSNGHYETASYFDVSVFLCEDEASCCSAGAHLGIVVGRYSASVGSELSFYGGPACAEPVVFPGVRFVPREGEEAPRFVWSASPELPAAFQRGELVLEECVADVLCE